MADIQLNQSFNYILRMKFTFRNIHFLNISNQSFNGKSKLQYVQKFIKSSFFYIPVLSEEIEQETIPLGLATIPITGSNLEEHVVM